MGELAEPAAAQVSGRRLDNGRVAELLRSLRQRTPREITVAVIGLGYRFAPEMWRALELLAAERSGIPRKKLRLSKRAEPLYE